MLPVKFINNANDSAFTHVFVTLSHTQSLFSQVEKLLDDISSSMQTNSGFWDTSDRGYDTSGESPELWFVFYLLGHNANSSIIVI